jgi:hypothetical protein
MCSVPSLVRCAKKNSIQHPRRELSYLRRVGSFGKWHDGVNALELMGYDSPGERFPLLRLNLQPLFVKEWGSNQEPPPLIFNQRAAGGLTICHEPGARSLSVWDAIAPRFCRYFLLFRESKRVG